jgi:uncharacterized membrane protein (DUF106 family)
MAQSKELKTIVIPKKFFESMIEIQKKWEEFSNEFEDFLLSMDKRFIRKMRKARKEHLEGKTRKLEELKQELE